MDWRLPVGVAIAAVAIAGAAAFVLHQHQRTREAARQIAPEVAAGDGIDVTVSGQRLGPGCVPDSGTKGPALPNHGGRHDFSAFVACMRAMRDAGAGITGSDAWVVPSPATSAATLVYVSNAVRCGRRTCSGPRPGLPYFEDVNFKVTRGAW